MGKAKWLKKLEKEKELKASKKVKRKDAKKSKKSKKAKKAKVYKQGESQYPIYIFNYKGDKITKLRSREEVLSNGLHLGSILLSVRDNSIFNGCYFSYNKSIQSIH